MSYHVSVALADRFGGQRFEAEVTCMEQTEEGSRGCIGIYSGCTTVHLRPTRPELSALIEALTRPIPYMLPPKQRKEHERLLMLWATRKATKAQMLRCMELDRLAKP